MWSIGCVVYELFTGRILFNGRTNNEMLKCDNRLCPFPPSLLGVTQQGISHTCHRRCVMCGYECHAADFDSDLLP